MATQSLVFSVFSVSYLCSFVKSVPTDFCYARLNKSDCGHSPTPVFTYYKPGSRCEIELWRGCPTLNRFNSEFECSHFCIGSLSPMFSAEINEINSHSRDEDDSQSVCTNPINTEDCGGNQDVFTYMADTDQCMKVKWWGCPTGNKFSTLEACEASCVKGTNNQDSDESSDSEESEESRSGEKMDGEDGTEAPDAAGPGSTAADDDATKAAEEPKVDEVETTVAGEEVTVADK